MYIIDNEFAKEVHKNAVAHGWWEESRSDGELLALIHSEWSEALEEYRDGKPLVYYNGDNPKPEGIAVELVDGCIRILDMLAARGEITVKPLEEISDIDVPQFGKYTVLPSFVAVLHYHTAHKELKECVCMVGDFLRERGIDPEALMREKHAYNVTRPYRHGGKKC